MKTNRYWFTETINFILRDLVKDGWRTFITIANLTTFLCCFFCLAALAQASKLYGEQDDNKNSLMLISKNVFDPSDSQITLEQISPILELIPSQAEAVSPMIFRLLKIETYLIQIRAAPPQEIKSIFSLDLNDGKWPEKLDEVVMGESTKVLTRWNIGQVIRIYGREFTIVGTVTSPGTKSSSVWMTLEAAEALFNTHQVYQFAWVKVAQGIDSAKVQESLQSDPRINKEFDVYFVDHLYAQYANALEDVGQVSLLLTILCLGMVMFGTYGSIFLTLSERNREITILRAIGFSAFTVKLILAVRTYVQILLSFILSWVMSAIILVFIQQRIPLMVHALQIEVVITGRIVLGGFLLVVLFGGIGIWIPTLSLKNSSVQSAIHK
jgi:ABC-type antimicrobial peptide transport system permease subunit